VFFFLCSWGNVPTARGREKERPRRKIAAGEHQTLHQNTRRIFVVRL